MSGMLALLSKGGSYSSRFNAFSKTMKGTMLESIRLAPKYKLSIEEIGDAYKELAQFGVVIRRQDVKPTLTTIAAIKEIATTTQSSSRQIRQEIQAIFNGQARVTDQFSRFAKRFPEIRKALFGINKLTTSNAEKWRLATAVMEKYYFAIQKSNETLSAQYTVIKNNISIISMVSLEASGIFKRWLGILTKVSNRIIDSDGHLGDLGVTAFKYFGYTWQLLSKIVTVMVKFGHQMAVNIKRFVEMIKQTGLFRGKLLKTYGGMLLMLSGLKMFFSFGHFAFGFLINKMTLFIAAIIYGRSAFIELQNIKPGTTNSTINIMHKVLKKSWEILEKIILALTLFDEHPKLIAPALSFKLQSSGLWKAWRIDASASIDIIEKQIKAAGKRKLPSLYKEFKAQSDAEHGSLDEHWSGLNRAEYILSIQDKINAKANKARLVYEKHLKEIVKLALQTRKKLEPIWADYFSNEPIKVKLNKNLKRVYGDAVKHGKSIIERGNEDFERFFAKWFKVITGLNKEDLKITFEGLDPKDWEKFFAALGKGVDDAKIKFNDFNAEAKAKSEEFKTKAKAVYEYVGDSFGKFVGDSIRGEITSLSDAINGFLNMIRDAFANAFQDIATDMAKTFMQKQFAGSSGNIMSFLASPFGKTPVYSGPTPSGVVGSGGAWGGTSVIAAAEGGIINEPVFGIGASGRTYTFAEKGPERVLSNKDSFGGSSSNVVVNVINKSSTPVDARVGDTKRQLRNLVTEVILEDRRRGGVISRG